MPDLTQLPTSNPAGILRYRDRQYAAELIAAALLHFDLFTWLDQHPGCTQADVEAQFGFAARPTDVLLTLCRANGFLRTDPSGHHHLTDLAREHLVQGSPWFLGPYYKPISDTPITRAFLQVLKTGKPENWQAKDEGKDWHESMLTEDFARDFTALMNCRGLAFGQYLAHSLASLLKDRHRILDVGGGSGIYSCTLVAAHPHLTATVLEQSPVDAITRREIEGHGLSGKVQVHTADMFRDAWPEDHDVLLFSNVLHDWDFPEVEQLVARAAKALHPGGLLVIHEAFIDDDKTGPLPVAEYSALLMNITQGKCYSAAEYGEVLKAHGFEPGAYQATIADRGYMTAVRV